MKKNIVIGLTGGIACGKNTVAEMFRNYGAYIIDADVVAHQALNDSSIKEKIVATFGESILNNKGDIERPKLGRIVFDNPDGLRALNAIVHPPVEEYTKAEIKDKLLSDEYKAIVINAPLLIEAKLTYMVDSVVLVYADGDAQMQRLAQMPFSEKSKFADFIINNNGSLTETKRQVKEIWETLMADKCIGYP